MKMIFLAILKGCSSRFWAIAIAVNCFRLKLSIGIIVGYVAPIMAWFFSFSRAGVGCSVTDNSRRKATVDFSEIAFRGCGSRLGAILQCERLV